MADCIFCAIAAHRAPAALICEDEHTLAFLDIHPIARGHTLVIPREHCADIFDLTHEAGCAVMAMAARVARALKGQLAPDGMNLLQSNGRPAGQTVFHFHFHVVPRWADDRLFLPHHPLRQAEPGDLEQLAGLLRHGL